MKKLFLFWGLILSAMLIAQPHVSIQDQKMLITNGESNYVLAPNGDDASYFWASVSPDGKHIVYVTARYGTFVCDINGDNVRSMGRMNAPKWLNNNQIAGMQEFYTGHDEIDHVRYISRNINTNAVRDLSEMERTIFINAENQRLEAARKEQAARIAARKDAPARTDLSGLKIYVNAGHGGYNDNDRSCWTIPVPETWTNPEGYWESKSNLTKALHLEEMLKNSGATVIMSRRTNKSGVRDLEYYPNATEAEKAELRKGDDRDLSAIAEEANANKVDHFLSIHTNALNASTNYLLMLFRGENDAPTTAPSNEMAAHSGNIQIQNQLTVWTSANPMVCGDLTFYGNGMGLGVLRPLTVPGFLSEGSFHDYAPETHRLMNDDYCKLEALRMYQHFHKWFGASLPQTATISGWVKSSNEKVDVLNEPNFKYIAGSDDQWLPINGAKVLLYKDGIKIEEKTTDNWYNGIFAFYDLEPGTYKVVASKDNYLTEVQEITVVAEEIAQVKMRMKKQPQNQPRIWAYNLQLTQYDNNCTFDFYSTADATSANLVFFNQDGSEADKVAISNVEAGFNTFTLALNQIPGSGQRNWGVELSADAIKDPYLIMSMKGFYMPFGVAVNTNPESEHFGKTYLSNPWHKENKAATGFYVFDPSMLIDNSIFNGSTMIGYKPSNLTLANSKDAIQRMAINPIDGTIAFAQWNSQPYHIYGLNPDNLAGEATPLSGNLDQPVALCYDHNNVLCAMNFDGKIDGKYVFSIHTIRDGVPTKVFSDNNWVSASGDNDIASDGRGGYWIMNGKHNVSVGQLRHVTKEGKIDIQINQGAGTNHIPNVFRRVRLAYDFKRDILAIGGDGKVVLYTVAYNDKDEATMTYWTETPMYQSSQTAWNTDGIAFDYAGDLVAASASSEYIYKYALPTNNNTCITPAPKALVITKPSNPTAIDNTVVAPQVEKIVRNGQVLIIRDGKTYNMMGQEVK